jgi:pyruvate,water dikinase
MSRKEEEKWLVFFEDCGKDDSGLVGGKSANLGEMCKLGIPVPGGFTVTSEVNKKFFEITGIDKKIEKFLSNFTEKPTLIDEFNEIGSYIQGVIELTDMPKAFQMPIARAYQALCDRHKVKDLSVAVRSSGIAEDMAMASFAGQYDSYLNVKGKEDVFKNILKCWASAFTPRCVCYRLKNDLPIFAKSVAVAVAVQKMVKSRASGVGFTVNPNTGNKTKIVLEGNWGVGESVVQGIVEPDRFEVDKETLKVVNMEIRCKQRQVVFTEKGTIEEDVPEEKQKIPCIEHHEAEMVAKCAKTAEEYYGLPLDIEWAIDTDLEFPHNVFLVQARPVTVIAIERSATEKILDFLCTRTFPVSH